MTLRACPTEDMEQISLMRWAKAASGRYPELAMLHHIPNGGSRHPLEAKRFKDMGVKPGVPDLCLPVPRGPYHGLYIELKRLHGGRVSEEQRWWQNHLSHQGYRAAICLGWEAARLVILDYLGAEANRDED